MLITAKDIDWSYAATKREVFERLFPDGAKVTVENARRAAGAGLSLRCAAQQLMGPDELAGFQKRARSLVSLYLENTGDTRAAVAALNPFSQKLEWMDANAAHEKNKITHWNAYLDGLATAFVTELEKQKPARRLGGVRARDGLPRGGALVGSG